jgi:hypothetical protein
MGSITSYGVISTINLFYYPTMVTKYLYLCILYIIVYYSVLGLTLVQLSSTYGLELVVDSFSTSYRILSSRLWSHLSAKIIFSLNIDFGLKQ